MPAKSIGLNQILHYGADWHVHFKAASVDNAYELSSSRTIESICCIANMFFFLPVGVRSTPC